MKRLTRSRFGLIGGVCAGLAQYFDIDVSIMRIIAILCLFSGIGVIPYLIMWIVIPTEF